MRASAWYDKTWTGEQGYYTNTSAGYMGNNKATGCEFNWRYAKRDMVGSAGSNMGISLEVFAPSLIKYMRDTSGKYADKILCKEDGVHIFDAAPIITAELRKAVHDFNMLRIRWAYVEHSKVHQSWGFMVYSTTAGFVQSRNVDSVHRYTSRTGRT